jgi:hypothetical protein
VFGLADLLAVFPWLLLRLAPGCYKRNIYVKKKKKKSLHKNQILTFTIIGIPPR